MSDERLTRLRSVPLFSELDDEAMKHVMECATEFEAPHGQVLAEGNMAGSGLVVIEEGSVTVELPNHAVTLSAGDFFGELSLLTSRPRVARVRAATDVRCAAISRHDFEHLLKDHPHIAVPMLRAVAARLADLEAPH